VNRIYKYFIFVLLFVVCNSTETPINLSSLTDTSGSTTNKIEINNSNWEEFIGKSNQGNFIALRVDENVSNDGVLVVFDIESLEKAIKDGGRVMNPLDRNVVDKMASIGILPLSDTVVALQKNLEPNKFTTAFNVQGDFHNSDITKINFTEYFTKYTSGLLPSFFIESVDNYIFMIGGKGNIVRLNINDGSVTEVESNLLDIIESQDYSSIVNGSDYSSRMGIRDTSFDMRNNTLLVTAIKKVEKNNCFTLGVLSSDMSIDSLSFSWTFEINHCEENFNSHQAGGRIQPFKEGYLLTVGDFKLPEDFGYEITEDSHLSKILLIDNDWNATIFSSGHRNPQGLTIHNETIFSSEHGPFGGDEVNIIEEGRDYGWPSSAYGFTYGLENIYELDHSLSFQEPIYFFTPSIGISEIAFYNQAEFPRWNDFLLVSSLKNMTLYTVKLDASQKNVIHVGELYIGERIRDFTTAANGELFLAGDLGNLIVINRTDQDIP
jgi:hypothetical protein